MLKFAPTLRPARFIRMPKTSRTSSLTSRILVPLSFAFVLSASLFVGSNTASAAAPAKPVAGVNYEDPNLAVSNDFVSDSVTSCPATMKGKALENCLERTGLKNSEIAQARVIDVDAVPLRPHRSGSR